MSHTRPARRSARTAAALALTGAFVGLSAAPALAVCDAYSGTCTEPPKVLPTSQAPAVLGTSTPSSLPFTGGELVLLSAAGVAALAGGTALVVAGRRRTGASDTPA